MSFITGSIGQSDKNGLVPTEWTAAAVFRMAAQWTLRGFSSLDHH